MFRSRSWFGGGWGRPKNPHSLEHLKYLYNVLSKNQTVSEHNRGLLVESLRCIAEILIWGDQNDSSVFDFFLEKNMLSFFLRIMRQRSGGSSYVCVQLLQTLNILFENIRNETSLYYLLSNNHVNSIIVHKFDFSDEEVMAYYISFLKTLSLKLNAHTIHFFYNEHTNDFPLYTEAIKFFNHAESMVRIAVRTLTLNVYKVEDASMIAFIRDRTAAPYFSNIVFFIGKHVSELDCCVRNDSDYQSHNRLEDLVAEHLDHLHYLNDILCLKIADLNRVLSHHLLQKLLVPLYISSLSHGGCEGRAALGEESANGRVSLVVALFLLSQVFLIITHAPLVRSLAWIILCGDGEVFVRNAEELLNCLPLEDRNEPEEESGCSSDKEASPQPPLEANITDEEKQKLATEAPADSASDTVSYSEFMETVFASLDCAQNDYMALFGLSLLYALTSNEGVPARLTHQILRPRRKEPKYNAQLVDKLLQIVNSACQPASVVRLVTLELCLKLLMRIAIRDDKTVVLSETHRGAIEAAKAQSTALLRNFYKSEEIFLDMFEYEYCDMSKGPLNVEWLCMDSAILLPPTGTPMTGIAFTKRLPCGEVERARRAIRVFFLVRDCYLKLNGEQETQLPLTNPQHCVQVNSVLDLSVSRGNSDLIACTVMWKDVQKIRRFLVIDVLQLILVEPDTKKLGWGVAKLVGFLQDIEVQGDKDDSSCLHITIHRPLSSSSVNRVPLLSAKFLFDDHIRCMAAKQRLTKGRTKARQKKMQQIARLLDIPGQAGPPSPAYGSNNMYQTRGIGRGIRGNHLSLFAGGRGPGFAAPRRDFVPACLHPESTRGESPGRVTNGPRRDSEGSRSNSRSSSRTRSREGSPKLPRPRSEEIPLELIKKSPNSSLENSLKLAAAPEEPEPVELPQAAELGQPSKSAQSEETSFIAGEDKRPNPKRKGAIETV